MQALARPVQAFGGAPQESAGGAVDNAELVDARCFEQGVRLSLVRRLALARHGHHYRTLAIGQSHQLGRLDRRYLDLQVDEVERRPRQAALVARHRFGRAAAAAAGGRERAQVADAARR